MSPRKWPGEERRESSIVIFRFSEVSKVDRCAGYGFLLVSPTKLHTGGLASLATTTPTVGSTRLPLFPRRKRRVLARPGSFDFTLQRTGCLTLIFLSLLLVIPLLSSSTVPPFNGTSGEYWCWSCNTHNIINESSKFWSVEEGIKGYEAWA